MNVCDRLTFLEPGNTVRYQGHVGTVVRFELYSSGVTDTLVHFTDIENYWHTDKPWGKPFEADVWVSSRELEYLPAVPMSEHPETTAARRSYRIATRLNGRG
jgi:hypothetical protein